MAARPPVVLDSFIKEPAAVTAVVGGIFQLAAAKGKESESRPRRERAGVTINSPPKMTLGLSLAVLKMTKSPDHIERATISIGTS